MWLLESHANFNFIQEASGKGGFVFAKKNSGY